MPLFPIEIASAQVEDHRIPGSGPQTYLDQYYFTHRTRQVSIDDLPLNIIQQILCYLPFAKGFYTTQHKCNVDSSLPSKPARRPVTRRSIWGCSVEKNSMERVDTRRYLPGAATLGLNDDALNSHQSIPPALPPACALSCVQTPWNWLEVIRVSRRWYTAANQSPSFHSCIATQNSFATRRSIVLSQNEPVFIMDGFATGALAEEIPENVYVAIEMAITRIVEISITLERREFAKFWKDLLEPSLNRPAPYLRRLQIHLIQSLSGLPTCSFTIPDDIFAGQAPLLRSIDIDEGVFTKTCPLFTPHLTSLILNKPTLPWQTPAELCEALARMPLLEVLSVRCPRGVIEEPQPPPKPKQKAKSKGKKAKKKSAAHVVPPTPEPVLPISVAFEHLHQLTLEASPNTVASLLNNIRIPGTASLQVGLVIDRHSPILNWEHGPLASVPNFYTKHLAAAAASGSTYTQATLTLEPVLHARDSREVVVAFSHPLQTDVPLPGSICLKIHWEGLHANEETIMIGFARSICNVIPARLSGLQIIQFDNQSEGGRGYAEIFDVYGDWWYDSFPEAALASVEELVIENRAALDYAVYQWSANMVDRPHLRALEQIIIRDFTFTERTWTEDEDGVGIHDYLSALVEVPRDCHVTFERCTLDSTAVKIIRDTVPDGKAHFVKCRTLISAYFERPEDSDEHSGYY
ncbi:hypothetical protein PENSPDRAFT_656883 [Peniophora sp. CONT]|nr:hypothetical protein PENSPDRAFT_656883 [Peniophora sp. CONT]